jgi:signal transduction histidine kinase
MPPPSTTMHEREIHRGGSWRRQESTFCIMHLVILAILFLVHTLFARHFGLPSRPLIAILAGAFLLRALQLIWIQGLTQAVSSRGLLWLASASVFLNLALAFAAAVFTDRADAQYFVLLVMPVVEAAFRFRLLVTIAVTACAAILNFLWIGVYLQRHGSVRPNEYFEAGTISMIYAFVGILVWMLINNLRRSETELAEYLSILRQTQEKLVREEKLAAIGRLSSSIAHEIRNPVAMISSSLAMAIRGHLESAERSRMFEIAAIQADRLEKLTNDFLAYARPRPPTIAYNNVSDILAYVAELAKARAAERNVNIKADFVKELYCECDATLLQQSLLNLLMNAIDAAPEESVVIVSAKTLENAIAIDVENVGSGIRSEVLTHIFEPFFTTKPGGSGLGLALAKNAAHAQGGELTLAQNGPTAVTFTLTLPVGNRTLTKATN